VRAHPAELLPALGALLIAAALVSAGRAAPQGKAGLPAVLFQDVTREAGIDFLHINGMTPEKYMPETMSVGGLFLDFDNDGWLDLYLVDSGSLADPELHRRARSACTATRETAGFAT